MDDIKTREEAFRKEVQEIGRFIYTQECLQNFSDYWTEPDRGKGKAQKARWQKEKTFEIGRRLKTWARNNFDGIQCYLTESEKTISQKKHAFAVSLEPYLEKYGRDTLNSFFRYFTQVQNVPNPTKLLYESYEFWDLGTRLSMWAERNNKYS